MSKGGSRLKSESLLPWPALIQYCNKQQSDLFYAIHIETK